MGMCVCVRMCVCVLECVLVCVCVCLSFFVSFILSFFLSFFPSFLLSFIPSFLHSFILSFFVRLGEYHFPRLALQEEDWTSSERETEAESDTEAFYYRQYRYREVMSQRAPAPDVRPKKLRRGATRGPSGPNPEEEMVSAWPMGSEPGPWPVSPGRGLLQTQWDAEPDERREVDLLQRVAEALSQFYGLGFGGVRLPSDVVNVVVVTEERLHNKAGRVALGKWKHGPETCGLPLRSCNVEPHPLVAPFKGHTFIHLGDW